MKRAVRAGVASIEHAFGTTEIAEEPKRVVTWGWASADAMLESLSRAGLRERLPEASATHSFTRPDRTCCTCSIALP